MICPYFNFSPVKEIIDKAPAIGAYTKRNAVYRQKMTVKSFRELALSAKYSNPKPESSLQEIERQFWRNITVSKPIYGADTPGFCFQPDVELFNVSKLGTILDLLKEEGISIPGVTSTYLYFGMYKTCFAWHNEDCDLYSINFLHFGEPKVIMGIEIDYIFV
jgi:jumonji domain-containing protein 2